VAVKPIDEAPQSNADWQNEPGLSDADWRKIRKITASVELPCKARRQIEQAINLFRLFDANGRARRPQDAKKALKRVQKQRNAFLDALDALDWEAKEARLASARTEIPSHRPLFRADVDDKIETVKDQINRFSKWVDAAVEEISRKPTRDPSNLRWFVKRLDGVLTEHGHGGISRSYKKTDAQRFVVDVVNIAFPGVFGGGAIDEAMKAAVTQRLSKSTAVVNLDAETAP
jgi:hypothetical protein